MNVLICRGDKEQIKQYTELNPDYLNALAEEMDELKSGVTAKLNKIIPFSSILVNTLTQTYYLKSNLYEKDYLYYTESLDYSIC